MVRHLLQLSLLWLCACGAEPTGAADAGLTCTELDVRFARDREDLDDGLLGCEEDRDCVMHPASLVCPDLSVTLIGCPFPIARENVAFWEARVTRLHPRYCQSGVVGCRTSALCAAERARCIEGACTAFPDR